MELPVLSGEPSRQRSKGWSTGSVGVIVSEQAGICLVTASAAAVRMCIPLRGGSVYHQAEQQATSRAGHCWVYLPDRGLHLTSTEDHFGVEISLQKPQLQRILQTMRADPQDHSADFLLEVTLQGNTAQRAVRAFPALLQHLLAAKAYGPDAIKIAEDVTYRFVARLLVASLTAQHEAPTHTRALQAVDHACSFLMANLNRRATLAALEAEVAVSSRTLQQAFNTHLGSSAGEWFRRQRLQVAWHLLVSSQLTNVTEAALACGFMHLGRFAGEFRAQFGCSPREVCSQALAGHSARGET